jgi:hypothetical protein
LSAIVLFQISTLPDSPGLSLALLQTRRYPVVSADHGTIESEATREQISHHLCAILVHGVLQAIQPSANNTAHYHALMFLSKYVSSLLMCEFSLAISNLMF